jgi:hypothetical protein
MFGGLFPTQLLTPHRGQNNARLLSPNVWSRVIESALAPDGSVGGWFAGDDFRTFGQASAVGSNVGRYTGEAGAYYSREDTGGAIVQLETERTGVVKMTTPATADSDTWLQPGDNKSAMCAIAPSAADRTLIFEARFRPQDLVGNRFIGLADFGTAIDTFITDAGALSDKNQIGFFALEGAPTVLQFGYKAAGVAAVTAIAALKTLVAATWYKVGFVYDPILPPSKRLKVFIDNVEQSTYVTATQIAAAAFPNTVKLQPIFGIKNVAATMQQDLDWWALFHAE